MTIATMKFSVILWGLAQALKLAAWRHPAFRDRLKERNLSPRSRRATRRPAAGSGARRPVTSGAGQHAKSPTSRCRSRTPRIGAGLLMPPINWLDQINAQKEFILAVDGPRGPRPTGSRRP